MKLKKISLADGLKRINRGPEKLLMDTQPRMNFLSRLLDYLRKEKTWTSRRTTATWSR